MVFTDIGNAVQENKNDAPLRKKPFYTINPSLRSYLKAHGREVKLPVSYDDLARITYSVPIKDKNGTDTYWEKALYDMNEWQHLRDGLIVIYAILKTEGDLSFINHLDVAGIDYCAFGNSNPFRIRVVNKFNDNYDHFYIKVADASRVYGLELEHILSPNRITYFTYNNTLVEEHIPGIPGDVFNSDYLNQSTTNKIRYIKEFVKFNERCFVRLLGDMRSYNYIVDITPDIEDFQYRIRAIDFDQQSYEGRKNMYLPQYFKENYVLVELAMKLLNKEVIEQYQAEERTLMAFRVTDFRYRLMALFNIMCKDEISPEEKTEQLKQELYALHKNTKFLKCKSMGDIVKLNLKHVLRKNIYLIQQGKRMKAL